MESSLIKDSEENREEVPFLKSLHYYTYHTTER